MTLTVEPTGDVYTLNGVECRRWAGKTEDGRDVNLYVRLVQCSGPVPQSFLKAGLVDARHPGDIPYFVRTEKTP
jgi:hypothetical protein